MIIGRWIGGLLGYKPFFKEYSTDWDFAVAKMKGSFFQRHLVHNAYTSEKSWEQQAKLDPGTKPTNAEYEQYTIDLSHGATELARTEVKSGKYIGNKLNGEAQRATIEDIGHGHFSNPNETSGLGQ